MRLSLLLAIFATAAHAQLKIDANFPGANIIVDNVEGDTVRLHPDLRDTEGNWFYWAFRVTGAQNRTLAFEFTQQQPIGVRGPAVSLDDGVTWRWLGRDGVTNSRFTYAFKEADKSVLFAMGMIYTQRDLERFLKPAVRVETLTTSRKGRPVERLRIGPGDAQAKHRVLVTARHHACEMMASYVVEGIIDAALADQWYQQHVELAIIPFVDKDGVEDGDQGKNRKPRDHNRDYDGQSVHPETAALRQWAPKWADGKVLIALDVHCPALRGPRNEVIYQVGQRDPRIWAEQQRFAPMLRDAIKGPLPYDPKDDLVFGREWNATKNFTKGENFTGWAATIAGVKLATTIEFPYANAGGKEVNAESARAFGHDLANALREYIALDDGGEKSAATSRPRR